MLIHYIHNKPFKNNQIHEQYLKTNIFHYIFNLPAPKQKHQDLGFEQKTTRTAFSISSSLVKMLSVNLASLSFSILEIRKASQLPCSWAVHLSLFVFYKFLLLLVDCCPLLLCYIEWNRKPLSAVFLRMAFPSSCGRTALLGFCPRRMRRILPVLKFVCVMFCRSTR